MFRRLGLVVLALVVLLGLTRGSYATLIEYDAFLSGPNESPPNASPGTGFTLVDYDNVAHTLHVQVSFSGLLGTTTASHIHATTAAPLTGTAGVATLVPAFPGFPLGVTSGSSDSILDLTQSTSWNSSFVTANGGTTAGAEAALAAAMAAGKSYLNIHTTVVGGGEIRGFLVPGPEPGSFGIFGVVGLFALARRRLGRPQT